MFRELLLLQLYTRKKIGSDLWISVLWDKNPSVDQKLFPYKYVYLHRRIVHSWKTIFHSSEETLKTGGHFAFYCSSQFHNVNVIWDYLCKSSIEAKLLKVKYLFMTKVLSLIFLVCLGRIARLLSWLLEYFWFHTQIIFHSKQWLKQNILPLACWRITWEQVNAVGFRTQNDPW